MTATNHVLTGAVIALAVKQPILAILLALASHFAVDLIPHFEARDLPDKLSKIFISTDVLSAMILLILLPLFLVATVSAWTIFACMLAGLIPDLVWGWRFARLKDIEAVFVPPWSWFSRIHYNMQWSESLQGGMVEILWLGLVITLIIKLTS